MTISRRSSGTWRARVKFGGRVVADRTFALKREAIAWEAEQKRRLVDGTWVDPKRGRESVRSVADRWLDGRRSSVASKTIKTERYLLSRMTPRFARLPIASVRSTDVEALFGDLLGSGLAYASVKRFRSVLSAMFGWAVRDRLIVASPTVGVAVPQGVATKPRREIFPFSLDELRAVYREQSEVCPDGAPLTIVLGLTGLRWGELCALRVRDVQTVPLRAFRVSRSAPTSEPVRTITKGGVDRTVPLVDEVWSHVAAAMEGKAAGDLLFTNTEGRRLNGWSWKQRVHWAETAQGRRVHDLRHTAATLWLSSGVPPKTVQAWLGHSSATLTLDTYSHFLPSSENRSGLDHMNKVLGDLTGTTQVARGARRGDQRSTRDR